MTSKSVWDQVVLHLYYIINQLISSKHTSFHIFIHMLHRKYYLVYTYIVCSHVICIIYASENVPKYSMGFPIFLFSLLGQNKMHNQSFRKIMRTTNLNEVHACVGPVIEIIIFVRCFIFESSAMRILNILLMYFFYF